LVDAWTEIEQRLLNKATDHWFRLEYPYAPDRLDPNDPTQVGFMDAWVYVRDSIMASSYVPSTAAQPGADPDEQPDVQPDVEPEAQPGASLFVDEWTAAEVAARQFVRDSQEVERSDPNPDVNRFVDDQLDTARALYLGHYFDIHDHWISPTRSFDGGVGFNDLGVEVRVMGPERHPRIGLVGNGPSSVGGWETYRGAATE
jgi:hypothetical protein